MPQSNLYTVEPFISTIYKFLWTTQFKGNNPKILFLHISILGKCYKECLGQVLIQQNCCSHFEKSKQFTASKYQLFTVWKHWIKFTSWYVFVNKKKKKQKCKKYTRIQVINSYIFTVDPGGTSFSEQMFSRSSSIRSGYEKTKYDGFISIIDMFGFETAQVNLFHGEKCIWWK